jgi:hypothetical protein
MAQAIPTLYVTAPSLLRRVVSVTVRLDDEVAGILEVESADVCPVALVVDDALCGYVWESGAPKDSVADGFHVAL